MYNYFKDNTPLNFLFLFFFLKLFTVLAAYYFNSNILGNVNFLYNDFFSTYSKCDLRSQNSFFTTFNCLFNIKDISNIYVVILAYFFSTVRDLTYILIFYKIVQSKYLLIIIVIFSIHPYLAIYHPRFTTNLFASFAFLLIFWLISSNLKCNVFILLGFIILTGFRNGLMPFFIIFILLEIYKNFKEINRSETFLYLITIFFIFLVAQIPKVNYPLAIIHDNINYFSWYNIIQYFSLENNFISYLVTFPFVFISHFILLLGFREAVFTDGLSEFLDLSFSANFQLIAFIILSILHFIGLIGFFRFYKNIDIRVWSFIAYFFPTILFVSHMRYFVPMIPLTILGLVIIFQNINSKTVK